MFDFWRSRSDRHHRGRRKPRRGRDSRQQGSVWMKYCHQHPCEMPAACHPGDGRHPHFRLNCRQSRVGLHARQSLVRPSFAELIGRSSILFHQFSSKAWRCIRRHCDPSAQQSSRGPALAKQRGQIRSPADHSPWSAHASRDGVRCDHLRGCRHFRRLRRHHCHRPQVWGLLD